jgi:hypothetical protein
VETDRELDQRGVVKMRRFEDVNEWNLDDNDHGGTSLTAVEGVSVSASPELAHAAPTHTPGPWSIEDVYDHEIMIASAATPAAGEWTIASVWRDCAYLQQSAAHNANLIAAAPEMYEALTSLANEATGFLAMADPSAHGQTNLRCLQRRIDEARAAIAKAEGRQP